MEISEHCKNRTPTASNPTHAMSQHDGADDDGGTAAMDPSPSPPPPPPPPVVAWPEDGVLTREWVADLTAALDWCSHPLPADQLPSVLPAALVQRLVVAASVILHREPNIVRADPRPDQTVVVVGDVHGQLHDVIFLLQDAGFPSEERIFVFNGDYVDRGAWGLETLLLLLAWKVLLQKSVFLLRGNHESKYCTSVYGFEQRSKERGHQKSDIGAQLPNRLGKMLAPLHWHDYKKHYGKLDDFVAIHPELFVIEGDFIHLCEGAQQIISATTAAAKIAAASSAPYSSLLPSVAVTPVAQSTRQKRVPVVDSRSSNTMPSGNGSTTTNFGDQFDKCSHIPKAGDPHQSFNIVHGISDVTVSNKVKDTQENGFSDEVRPGQSSMHALAANGGRNERAGLPMHDKGVSNIRHGYGGKQQGRSIGTTYISRR